jgi:hypothetical protein
MMDYTNVTNPVYASADKSQIHCMVQFVGFASPLPFSAMANDSTEHGPQIYADLVAGKYGSIGPYVPPSPLAPTPEQQYATAIAAGLVVTCSATLALNGTYGISETDAANISAEAQFIALYSEFTNSATTFPWADASGQPHTFPDTATFMAFAKAAAQYVSGCKQTLIALQTGHAANFPSNAVALG